MFFGRLEEFCARIVPYGALTFVVATVIQYLCIRYGLWSYTIYIAVCVLVGIFRYREKRYFLLACISLLLIAVWSTSYINRYERAHTFRDIPFGESVIFDGVIVSIPDKRFDKQFITVNPSGSNYNIRIRLEKAVSVTIGDRVKITGELHKPESFQTNTGVEFDYPRYLAVSNIVAEVRRVKSFTVEGYDSGYRLSRQLSGFRNYLQSIVKRYLPVSAWGLGLGTTLGSREFIDTDWLNTYRVAGLSHIIVLSGFNISIITVVLSSLFRRLKMTRTLLLISALACIWLFIAMIGFGASSVRAGVMASVVLLAQYANRGVSGVRALLYAVVVMALLNPRILLDDIGFQLSAMATLGLLVLSPLIQNDISDDKRSGVVIDSLQELSIATVCATLATFPLLVWKIGSVAGLGLVANVLVVWIVPYIMLGVLLVVLLSWIPVVALLCGQGVVAMVWYVNTLSLYTEQYTPTTLKANIVMMLASAIVLYWLLQLLKRVR